MSDFEGFKQEEAQKNRESSVFTNFTVAGEIILSSKPLG